MVYIVLLAGVCAVIGFLIFAGAQPDAFRVQRTATIEAPADKVFAQINDFHNWRAWSPWEGLDPDLKRNYAGASSGKGAVYEWEGNAKVGQGRMEIVESLPSAKIAIKMDFIKPFAGHSTVEFSLAPQGGATLVAWTMQSPVPYMMKIMHLFVDMDKMLGKNFEDGLAKLKTAAEK